MATTTMRGMTMTTVTVMVIWSMMQMVGAIATMSAASATNGPHLCFLERNPGAFRAWRRTEA